MSIFDKTKNGGFNPSGADAEPVLPPWIKLSAPSWHMRQRCSSTWTKRLWLA